LKTAANLKIKRLLGQKDANEQCLSRAAGTPLSVSTLLNQWQREAAAPMSCFQTQNCHSICYSEEGCDPCCRKKNGEKRHTVASVAEVSDTRYTNQPEKLSPVPFLRLLLYVYAPKHEKQ